MCMSHGMGDGTHEDKLNQNHVVDASNGFPDNDGLRTGIFLRQFHNIHRKFVVN